MKAFPCNPRQQLENRLLYHETTERQNRRYIRHIFCVHLFINMNLICDPILTEDEPCHWIQSNHSAKHHNIVGNKKHLIKTIYLNLLDESALEQTWMCKNITCCVSIKLKHICGVMMKMCGWKKWDCVFTPRRWYEEVLRWTERDLWGSSVQSGNS